MATKKTKTTKLDAMDEPWVANYPPLQAWLQKIEARCLSQTPTDGTPFKRYIEVWQAPGSTPFIVLVRSFRHGWDIFTPANTTRIDTTLADAEARIFSKEFKP